MFTGKVFSPSSLGGTTSLQLLLVELGYELLDVSQLVVEVLTAQAVLAVAGVGLVEREAGMSRKKCRRLGRKIMRSKCEGPTFFICR